MISPTKSLEAQIDAMIETDLSFSRESRYDLKERQFPEQLELIEEEDQ